jgi:hypothetical protein
MLDKRFIGHEFEAFTSNVEKGRLRFFANSIGETNPIYSDEDAARDAGHPALPAPPTFTMVLDTDGPELWPMLSLLKMDIGLHNSTLSDPRYLRQKKWCAGVRHHSEHLHQPAR